MGKPIDPAERAERLIRELRAATSEAAGVVKDLAAVTAEAKRTTAALADTAVADSLMPVVRQWQERIDKRIMDAEVEIRDRFNETSTGLEALMQDFVDRGNVYKIGMPVVEGVVAVQAMIDDVLRRQGK